jgi:RNA polymerase sigma-70 factor (ECF subfamily)
MADQTRRSHEGDSNRLTPLEEQRCIGDAQKGCAAASRRLIESHQDRLFAFVWRMIRDQHDAEEICQDAFLRAFQALDTFDTRYRFSTWLFTIAYRLCLNTMRRRRDYSGDVDLNQFRTTGPHVEPNDDATEMVANTEQARAVRSAIWDSVDQLSAPQRAAVLLFYRESMSCQDIGDIMHMPAATVKSHLHRARARLKDMLADRVGDGWTEVQFARAADA